MKEEIKAWLKKNNRDRYWLAEKCLVDKKTVDDWFRSRGVIPRAKLALIEEIMRTSESHDRSVAEECKMKVSFTPAQFTIIKRFLETFPSCDLEEYMRVKAIEFAAGLTNNDAMNATAHKYGNPGAGDIMAAENDAPMGCR